MTKEGLRPLSELPEAPSGLPRARNGQTGSEWEPERSLPFELAELDSILYEISDFFSQFREGRILEVEALRQLTHVPSIPGLGPIYETVRQSFMEDVREFGEKAVANLCLHPNLHEALKLHGVRTIEQLEAKILPTGIISGGPFANVPLGQGQLCHIKQRLKEWKSINAKNSM